MKKIKYMLSELLILSIISGITPAIICGIIFKILGL